MASVTAKVSFSCPNCDKVLKSSTRPVPGKKIKCPACGEAFVPEVDDDENEESGIQEKPKLKSKSASKANAGGKARKRVDDDEDGGADEERPAKKKAKQKSGGGFLLIGLLLLGGGGLFLVCAGVGVGAFVWPGFMLSKKADDKNVAAVDAKDKDKEKEKAKEPGKEKEKIPEIKVPVVAQNNNIGNYMLPDAMMLFGSNVKGLRDKNQLEPLLNQIDGLAGPGNAMPAELKDLTRNAERMMVSVQLPAQQAVGAKPKLVIAILASNAEFVTKFRNLPKLGQEEKLAGKYSVYRPGLKDNDWPPLVVCPSDRILLLCEMNDAELTTLLDKAANNPASSPALKMANSVESAHFWGTLPFDDNIKQAFNGAPADLAQLPQLAGAIESLKRSKGSTLAANIINDTGWQVQVGVECANPQDAEALKAGGEVFIPLMMIGFQNGPPGTKPSPTLLKDLNTIKFQTRGPVANLNLQIASQSLTDLAKLGMMGTDRPAKEPPFKEPPFKEPPFKEPPPTKEKILPPPIGGAAQSYWVKNLAQGSSSVQAVRLNKGQRIKISADNQTPATMPPRNNVDVYVYKDNTSDIKNIIAYDEKPQRNDQWTKITFNVPESGTYYIQASNKGPGVTKECFVTIEDFTGQPDPTKPKDPPSKDKEPKINPKAIMPPAQYAIPNFVRGHTDEKLFIFQPNKQTQVTVQCNFAAKKSADIEIVILAGDKGDEVVARSNRILPVQVLTFVPKGPPDGVYRVRIHNKGPNTPVATGVAVVQAP